MQFGFVLPRSNDGQDLCRFAERADALGVESIWAGDHVVLPTDNTNQYPYSADGSLTVPVDSPSLDVMTVLSFIASRTSRVRIGSTVIIVPYRNPLVQAKMFSSLDVLTGGRVICGVGVGWLQKEFETLGVPYAQRGAVTDEYLAAFKCLWTEPNPASGGRDVSFHGIQFYPKPVQEPHLPSWVGGHSRRAVRRAVAYGDAWHPTRQTPEYVAGMLPYLRQQASEAGRDPDSITISLKRSLHFTDLGFGEVPGIRSGAAIIGDTQHVLDDVRRCAELGIRQLTYDFRTNDADECIQTMEHFLDGVASAL